MELRYLAEQRFARDRYPRIDRDRYCTAEIVLRRNSTSDDRRVAVKGKGTALERPDPHHPKRRFPRSEKIARIAGRQADFAGDGDASGPHRQQIDFAAKGEVCEATRCCGAGRLNKRRSSIVFDSLT